MLLTHEADKKDKIEKKYKAKNIALVAINPNNGEILAMIGGRDFQESQVNIWMPEKEQSFQSPGSTFKPIVYASAFKKGYTLDTIIWDVRINFGGNPPYVPQNYDGKFRGPITMKEALAQSLNVPAVKTLYLVGISHAADLAKKMGMFESFKTESSKIGLSMAIGGKDIIPLELVSAYGVLATEGTRHLPKFILKIEDKNKEIIFEAEKKGIKVLDTEICRQINYILSDNNLRAPMFGLRSPLNLGPSVAVKTGTAANERDEITDLWTIGYTKNLVVGVWIGNNKNEPFKGLGAGVAAPLWHNFIKEVTKNHPKENFTPPQPIKTDNMALKGDFPKIKVKINKITKKIATDNTPPELIEEKEFYQPYSILQLVNKNNPRLKTPSSGDPLIESWEEGIIKWLEETEGLAPKEKDDVYTFENKPKIEILSKNRTTDEINFTLKIIAPMGTKRTEVFLEEKSVSLIEGSETSPSFIFKTIDLGEKSEYRFKIIVTDTVENKGEIELVI